MSWLLEPLLMVLSVILTRYDKYRTVETRRVGKNEIC